MLNERLAALEGLPLSGYRDAFVERLTHGPLLLEAEPGAGKSTLAPLWALAEAPEGESVWLVQPRVLAARALARRLAQLLGEETGQTLGYQVPYDRCAGASTRLLVMTPGVLLQHLLSNPTLEGVATVMLDEMHERSVTQDTAWAWLQEAQVLRESLQLVAMTATPDPALQAQIDQCLSAPGRCYPVSLDYRPAVEKAGRPQPLPDQVLHALDSVPDWRRQTVLVFLPGWRAIASVAAVLEKAWPEQPVYRLHSRVSESEQQQALEPGTGARVILATNIAETSLTIQDVTLVIDSGQVRQPDFEQRTGISRLHTRRISRASADQRRGRAGRVAPGHCIRLWSKDEPLAPADRPEIGATDYVPLALRLAHWGSPVGELPWLEPPNRQALKRAYDQLRHWRLLDEHGAVTQAGRQVSALGTHPRLAAFLQAQGQALTASALHLALGLHFGWEPEGDMDDWLNAAAREAARHPHWRQQRRRWLRVLKVEAPSAGALDLASLAWAFSDRIGSRQETGRYRLNSGISVTATAELSSEWAVFPAIRVQGQAKLGLGVAWYPDETTLRSFSEPHRFLIETAKGWHQQTQWRMGGRVIAEDREPLAPEAIPDAVMAEVEAKGLRVKHWPLSARNLLRRARLAKAHGLGAFPDLSESALLAHLPEWLGPFLNAQSRLDQLPWFEALSYYLGPDRQRLLAQRLPDELTLPSGRRVAIRYPDEGLPEIEGKLQEFFGCQEMVLADGQVPLRIHLRAPNGSSLAITTDLASFWAQAYPDVRKQMRGRYPKHPWPENPLNHQATRLTKKRLGQGG